MVMATQNGNWQTIPGRSEVSRPQFILSEDGMQAFRFEDVTEFRVVAWRDAFQLRATHRNDDSILVSKHESEGAAKAALRVLTSAVYMFYPEPEADEPTIVERQP